MIPVYQDTENGCFRAAVASVLELSPIYVPDLHGSKDWHTEFHAWCRDNRYMCRFYWDCKRVRNGFYIAVGHPPGKLDRTHAVVHKGPRMVHDPHQSRLGIAQWLYSIELKRLGI